MCAYNFLREIISNYTSFVYAKFRGKRASAQKWFSRVYKTIIRQFCIRNDGDAEWLHNWECNGVLSFFFFSFYFLCCCNMRLYESYGGGVVMDLNARCLRQQLRVFAEEARFCKIKAFYSNRMYSYGRNEKNARK